MSWSISRGGKPADVASALRSDLAASPALASPEQQLKEKAVELAILVVESQSPDNSVSVSAYGSASIRSDGQSSQSVTVSVSASLPT